MVDIIIESENKLVPYKINFEDAKNYLKSELEKYQNLCVTEEFIQSAKSSRAELNKKKKELSAKFTEIKKLHNEPINQLKIKVDELINLIDEPLNKIDEQIKAYEEKLKEQKQEFITEVFEDAKRRYNFDKVELKTIFNEQWLNVTYTKKKISSEIEVFFSRVTSDLKVIESFEDEFVIPLTDFYLKCFDMSAVMQRKVAYDKAKKEKEEQEALERKKKEEQEKLDQFAKIYNEAVKEPEVETVIDKGDVFDEYFEGDCDIPAPDEVAEIEEIPEQEPEKEYIEFWVKVTPEQKLMLRELVLNNNIECGKLVR